MAGGAGHVSAMTSRLKQNRALLNSKKERYAKYDGRYAKHNRPDKLYSKKISHSELRKIKKNIQVKAQKERRETFWIAAVLTAILTIISLWFFK